jgi:hypothetical protein
MNQTLNFPALGAGPHYSNLDIWLPLLFHEAAQRGEAVLDGKTFTNCRIQGPAVIVPIAGCQFNACSMGNAEGDMRNLLLQPLGPTRVNGVIPFSNCVFERCEFVAVGYAGASEFLEQLKTLPSGAPSGAAS